MRGGSTNQSHLHYHGVCSNATADATISTTRVTTGSESLRINPSTAVGFWLKDGEGTAPSVVVMGVYVRFA